MATNPSSTHVGVFQPDNESISAYLESVLLFYKMNGIAEERQTASLLNVMRVKTYLLVRALVAPDELKSKSVEQLTQVLKQHYEPKCLVISR